VLSEGLEGKLLAVRHDLGNAVGLAVCLHAIVEGFMVDLGETGDEADGEVVMVVEIEGCAVGGEFAARVGVSELVVVANPIEDEASVFGDRDEGIVIG
jgi:hypothetical protein